jgi:histidinol-phosphatase (PHP family)
LDTPEDTVKAAIEKGFDSIGFSGHSYMSFAPYFSMSIEGTEEYKKEVRGLKRLIRTK